MSMNKDVSNVRRPRKGRRVARRRYQTGPVEVDRAAALEEAARQYISDGYEMTEFTDFAVRLRGPRRMRWLHALILVPLCSVIVWLLTDRPVLAYGAGAITLFIDVMWNTAMKPHHTIVLGVDKSGQVTEVGT